MSDITVVGDDGTQVIIQAASPTAITIDGTLRGVQGEQGDPGIQGEPGVQGVRGSQWYEGAGAPGATQNNGDYYLDVNTGNVYNQQTNAWVLVGNIQGPAGAPGSGGDMLLGTAQTVTAPKTFNLNTLLDKGSMVYNTNAFGSVGDGVTDDTTAIQAAINAANAVGGGIVQIPMGTHIITSALVVYPNIIVIGNGINVSVIKQTTANTDAFTCNDVYYGGFLNLEIRSAVGHTSGSGINLEWTDNGNVEQMNLTNLLIIGFHVGVSAETLITSQISNVECLDCDIGMNFTNGGTSLTINNTYMNGCLIGYQLNGLVYISFNGTACDSSTLAYSLTNCAGISFNGCGCESGVHGGSAPTDGRGWYITGCIGITFNATWNYLNPSYAYYITNSSSILFNNVTENGPAGTAINGIFIDTNCARVTAISPNTITSNSLQTSGAITTLIADIGGNAIIPGNVTVGSMVSPLFISGSSGDLYLSSNPDGGAYNLFVGTTGTLAIYGSGAATLNVELLDGYLQLDTLTATTVPYLNSSKQFVSSAVTPTELGYVSGVTSAIQTQLSGKQATITFGTGVLTALGVAVGSAGAPVLYNGAAGTPSSINLTNAGAGSLAISAISATGTASSTTYLRGDGSWSTVSGGMTNPMTTLGDIIYENATPAPARLAGNTTTAKQYLSQTGNGTISAAPAWATIAAADLSNGVQGSGAVVLASSPTLTTPTLGAASATSINKVTITAPATSATLTLVTGSSLITAGAFSLTLTTTATTNVTFPSGTVTLVATTVATLSSLTSIGTIGTGVWQGTKVAPAYGGTGVANNAASTITISGAYALTLTLTAATSVTLPTSGTLVNSVTTGNGVSASNTGGALAFTLGAITPSSITSSGNGQFNGASANSLTVAVSGTTNPTFNVDDSIASVATGLNIQGQAAAGGLKLAVLSSGTNEGMTLDGKGSGTIGINTVSTTAGLVTIGNSTAYGGALVNGILQVAGTSGTLHFESASDGADYNIYSSNGNQTLAIYGSSSNTLNVNLLDGNFTVSAGTSTLTGNVGIGAAASTTIPLYVYQGGAVTYDTVFIQNNTTGASGKILHVANDTNYAFSGQAIVAELYNGTDSGIAIQVKNAGTGKSLSIEDDAGNTKFAVNQNGSTNTGGSAAITAPTFISTTAQQLSTTADTMVYIDVKTAASLTIAIGAASTATTILQSAVVGALGMISVRVPAGWYLKLTGTMADLTITAITC